ncbi:MAG: hypothetical protein ABR969_06255 [Sedimentisphaerales bacterium]|jgi:hypothetical protein
MASHGYFHIKQPNRPLIVALFSHPSIKHARQLEFIIDTGADRTFIVPDWQKLLDIHDKDLREYPGDIHTFAGTIKMRCLDGCSLIFPRYNPEGNPKSAYQVSNLRVFFAANSGFFSSLRRKPLTGAGKFPNVLGRDVLQQMSLGYCKTSSYLFVTQRTKDYQTALTSVFPNPQEAQKTNWFDL